MKSSDSLRNIWVLVLLMAVLQWCQGFVLGQSPRRQTSSGRGLKVPMRKDTAPAQQTNTVESSATSDSDKPRLVVQLGHGVSSVAYSRDGRFVLTGGGQEALLWDIATGREIRRFIGHTGSVLAVAYSPDGRFVLTGSGAGGGNDNSARLWDAATGREIRRLNLHPYGPRSTEYAAVHAVAFSPDGKSILTGSGDKTARLRDVETGREVRRFIGHSAIVTAVAYSPDGKLILTGSTDRTARLWNAATGLEVKRLVQGNTNNSAVMTAAYSPDGRFVLIATGIDKTARLWETQTGKPIRIFEGHTGFINAVVFSPDAKQILTGSSDKTARPRGRLPHRARRPGRRPRSNRRGVDPGTARRYQLGQSQKNVEIVGPSVWWTMPQRRPAFVVLAGPFDPDFKRPHGFAPLHDSKQLH